MVLHPGSAKTGDVGEAIARAGETIREALADSEGCELHLENTAGAGGTLGRSFDELAALLDAAGGERAPRACAWTPATCSPPAMTSAPPRGMDARCCARGRAKIGRGRVGSLHLNDSQTPLGSNRDRHANVGEGELGEDGCAAFLSAPALQKLPCVLGDARREPRRSIAQGKSRWPCACASAGIARALRSNRRRAGLSGAAVSGRSRRSASGASACSSSARSVGVCCTR